MKPSDDRQDDLSLSTIAATFLVLVVFLGTIVAGVLGFLDVMSPYGL